MAAPPTWAPVAGVAFGDWVGKAITPTFTIWDYAPELNDEEYLTNWYGASAEGVAIDQEIDYATVRSDDNKHRIILPDTDAYEVGHVLRIHVGSDMGVRVIGDPNKSSVLVNGQGVSSVNELVLPGRATAVCTVINDNSWHVTATSLTGAPLTLSVVTRGS